ncbi:MAG: YncE family protein [Planctomycetes bacterium]|nr:YncE family protein [Planctomycetota bacterium]MCP4771537.1 YncE family protein [Planctomycetota bacterium]
MRKACTLVALTAVLCATPVAAQSFKQEIDLVGLGDPLNSAKPFGISYEPVSDRIYVAIAGDFAGANHAVAVIDPATDTILSSINVGLYPEDIAFHYDSNGALVYGAVTNSTSGSVTIWDANHTIVATIPLPDPFGFGTCYPFGILAHDGNFLISTADGSGDIHAIDIATLSYDPLAGFNTLFRSNGRMIAVGDEVWVPTSEYTPSFDGSMGGLFRHNRSSTNPDDSWYVESMDNYAGYPGGQDVVRLSNGRGYLSGLDFLGRIYRLDAQGNLDRGIDLMGIDGYGLALEPVHEELLAVCGFTTNELVLVDLLNDELLTTTSLGGLGYTMPNDAVFAHDKLYVTMQGNEAVVVFDNLPGVSTNHTHESELVISDTTPNLGDSIHIDFVGYPGHRVAIFTGFEAVPSNYTGLDLEIGPTPVKHSNGLGSLSLDINIPTTASLANRHIFLQGYLTDGVNHFMTEPKVVVIQ